MLLAWLVTIYTCFYPKNDLEHLNGQEVHHLHVTTTDECGISKFRPFRSTKSRFKLSPNFRKSVLNDPKWPWRVQGKKYQHACYIHPRGVTPFFFRKVHQMNSNDLGMFKVQYTNIYPTYTPEAHIFVRFALQWTVFELRPIFQKSAPNDPKWLWHVQGKKYQRASYKHPRVPKFSSVLLYGELFPRKSKFLNSPLVTM